MKRNYGRVAKWLLANQIPFAEYNDGGHLKVAGATTAIELWPGTMKYHILESEDPRRRGYASLSRNFRPEELNKLLNE